MGKQKVPVGPRRPRRVRTTTARRTLQGHLPPPSTAEDVEALKRSLASARRARDDAERSGLAKDQFVAVIAHELRTPLAALQLQTQLLRRAAGDPATLERVCDAVDRSVRLQLQLVDDLLDVSRIVTGKLKVALEPVDLVATVRSVLEAMGTLAETADLQLRGVLDESLGEIAGDRTRLAQILSNLLGNAIKFTPPGGRIEVVLERIDGLAHLRVTDTGVGIEPHLLDHIFDRLTQIDAAGRRRGGLGLGLAIARYLVDAHGGTIRAESAGPGRGTTFLVTLPLLASRRTAPADWRQVTPSSSSAGSAAYLRRLAGRSLLVIESDAGLREVLGDMLRETGALVSTAESAAAGLGLVRELRPAAVICDIAMPGEDGNSFIRKLRALGEARGGETPALALTAGPGELSRRRAVEAGFQAHLTKPIELPRLAAAVLALLDGGPPPSETIIRPRGARGVPSER